MNQVDLTGRTIVVTGARGRIGQLLSDQLIRAGGRVVEVDVVPPSPRSEPGRAYVQADLSTMGGAPGADLVEALGRADAVAHLAALMSWDDQRMDDVYRVNALGTLNLLRAMETEHPPRLVLASTGEVYPELAPAYLPIDEAHPTRPTSHYGLSKLMAEEAARFFGRRTGAEVVIVRFSHTQRASELADPESFFSGPRFFVGSRLRRLRENAAAGAAPALAEAIRRLEAVEQPGKLQLLLARGPDGTPYRMGIADARDIVQGVVLALTHPSAPGEVFNIGPAAAFSFEDAIPAMARRWGLPFVPVELPLTPYQYETSVEKARLLLGYAPRFTIFDMIDEAASSLPFGHSVGAAV